MTATEFGHKIAGLRNEKKMTQTELAEVLGVSTQAVSKWETGGGFPDVQTVPDIARALDTTTDYLFNRVRRQQKVFVFNVPEVAATVIEQVDLHQLVIGRGVQPVQHRLIAGLTAAEIQPVDFHTPNLRFTG